MTPEQGTVHADFASRAADVCACWEEHVGRPAQGQDKREAEALAQLDYSVAELCAYIRSKMPRSMAMVLRELTVDPEEEQRERAKRAERLVFHAHRHGRVPLGLAFVLLREATPDQFDRALRAMAAGRPVTLTGEGRLAIADNPDNPDENHNPSEETYARHERRAS